MDIINKILELLNRKNKTQKDLTDFLGLSKYIFSDWKSGKNSSYLKYISQIAVFLDVSTDYLLGNDDKKTSLPSENDKLVSEILNKFPKLTPEQQDIVLKMVDQLAKDKN